MNTAARSIRKAHKDELLTQDISAMLREGRAHASDDTLAHDIVVVVRERVLREIASYARENIR